MRVVSVLVLTVSMAQTAGAQAPASSGAQTPAAPPASPSAPERPSAASASEPPPMRPAGTMSELMIDIIYPTSDEIFYISRGAPKNDIEWNIYKGKMLMLAESANLLMMPGRARDQDKWMKDSKMLLDVGIKAFRAAKAKDVPAIEALSDELYNSCVQCHADYRRNYRTRPLLPTATTP